MVLLIASAHGADVDELPPTGNARVVTGAVLLGVSSISLAAASPVCGFDPFEELFGDLAADAYSDTAHGTCRFVMYGVSVGTAIAGVPLLVTGLSQRRAYDAWQDEQRMVWLEVTFNAVAVRGVF